MKHVFHTASIATWSKMAILVISNQQVTAEITTKLCIRREDVKKDMNSSRNVTPLRLVKIEEIDARKRGIHNSTIGINRMIMCAC